MGSGKPWIQTRSHRLNLMQVQGKLWGVGDPRGMDREY